MMEELRRFKATDKAYGNFPFRFIGATVLLIGALLTGCTHMIQVGEIPDYPSEPKEKLNTRVLLIFPDDITNYTYKQELALDKWVIPIGNPVSDSLRRNIAYIFNDVLEVRSRQEGRHADYSFTLRPSIVSFKTSSPPQSPYQSWAKITLKIDVLDNNDKLLFSKIASGYGVTGTGGAGLAPIQTGDKNSDAAQLAYLISDLPEVDFASKKSLARCSRTAIHNAITLLLNSIYDADEFVKYRKDLGSS